MHDLINQNIKGRSFQVWEFRVSHGQLLIRSPKSSTLTTNVDLVFKGVMYVNLIRHLPNPILSDPNPDEILELRKILGDTVEQRKVFILESGGHRFSIVAELLKVEENDLDIFENNLEKFGSP